MTYRFDNGEVVQYDTERFGKGKGIIVGYCDVTGEYVVYPKVQHDWPDYPFLCLLVKSENLISESLDIVD